MSEKTARLVRFHQIGGPEVLRIEEHEIPNPGEGEVRLRVRAIGLNRAEAMYRRGKYFSEPAYPAQLGYEASGIVEAVGPGVDKDVVGKQFSTMPNFNFKDYGVYGEVAIVPVSSLVAYPDKLSPEEGTSIWMQYLTAYGALIDVAKLTRGDFVLITAASSSVGLAAIQVVKAEGGTSIAVTRTAEKKAELIALGADHVIVSNDESIVERVNQITNDKGARIIFDPVAGKGIETLTQAAAVGGMYICYGMLSGESTPFPMFPALMRELWLRAYGVRQLFAEPETLKQAQQYVFERLDNGTFEPKIAKTFTFDEIVEAHRYLESNQQIGKVVVTVG